MIVMTVVLVMLNWRVAQSLSQNHLLYCVLRDSLAVVSMSKRVTAWNIAASLYDAAIDRFLDGEPITPDPSLPEGVQMLLKSLETPANLPFARELWTADAAPLLRQVDVPVLVIIGKKDLQVDWQTDGKPLQQAATGHELVTFFFPENANHVLKEELRPRSALVPAEITESYNGPDTHLDPEALASILEWLAAHT